MPSVLADFLASAVVETTEWDDPIEARVLLSKTQLVIARDEDDTAVVSLDDVFDVNAGWTPGFVDPLPGRPVTVAFRAGGDRVTAVVAADRRTSETFEAVLFKAVLNGTYVTLKHPSKIGGRVLDTEFQGGLLSLTPGGVRFDVGEGPISIPLDSVVDFARERRTVDGEERPVLVASHVADGEVLETVAATESVRKLSLLGRYLRGTYDDVLESLTRLRLSEAETGALTAIYSARGADVSLPQVLGTSPESVRRLLQSLHEKGLIESGESGPLLTARGQIVVTEYLERVNA